MIPKFLVVNLEKCSRSALEGNPGDGDGTQGSCDDGKFCYHNTICSDICSGSGGMPGDGNGINKGNCQGTNDICTTDGMCEGIYYHKKVLQLFVINNIIPLKTTRILLLI